MDYISKRDFLITYETAQRLGEEFAEIVAENFVPDEMFECEDNIGSRFIDSIFDFYFIMDDFQFIRFLDIIYELCGEALPAAFNEYIEESDIDEHPLLSWFLEAFIYALMVKMTNEDGDED